MYASKTVEIIVEEKSWRPTRFKDVDILPVVVGYVETELRERWSPEEKLWFVPYRLIRGTELEKRIPEER